jgi:hypothetical protein
MTSDSEARRRLYRDLNRARSQNTELQSLADELQAAHQALLGKCDAQHEALVHIDQLVSAALTTGMFDTAQLLRKIAQVTQEQLWTQTSNGTEWGDAA